MSAPEPRDEDEMNQKEKIQSLLGPRPDNIEDFSDVLFGADVVEEEAEARGESAKSKAVEIIGNYIPDEWQGRTVLQDKTEAKRLSLLRTYGMVFDEIDQSVIAGLEQTIEHEEMYRTAIEGMNREEYMKILQSAVGSGAGSELERGAGIGAMASRAFEEVKEAEDE